MVGSRERLDGGKVASSAIFIRIEVWGLVSVVGSMSQLMRIVSIQANMLL